MKPIEKILNRLVKNIKTKPINLLDIHEYINVYDINTNSISYHIRPLYRICFATTVNGKDVFTLHDEEMQIDRGINEIAMVKQNGKIKLKRSEQWQDNIQGKFVKSVHKLDSKEFFKLLKELNIPWNQILNWLMDDTMVKDRRIVEITKATYLPFPVEKDNFWASVNNHSIIVTNSGVGKSTTYARLTGKQPGSDYSIPGLVGTVGERGTVVGGSLNGKGLYVFDEFPQTNDQRSSVVTSLLNYMESGETMRDLAQRITCTGTKTLVFMGNVPEHYNEKNFQEILFKLAGRDAMQRVGRRLGHVLFGQHYAEVNPTRDNPKHVGFLRYVLESAVNQNRAKIQKVLNKHKNWVLAEDEHFVTYYKGLSRFCSFRMVGQFLEGHARSYSRIKCGALKWAIIQNLDKISLLSAKDYDKIIKSDMDRIYSEMKKWDFESFNFLVEGKKSKVAEMFNEGKSIKEISDILEIYHSTVKEWIEELKIAEKNNLDAETEMLRFAEEKPMKHVISIYDLVPITEGDYNK